MLLRSHRLWISFGPFTWRPLGPIPLHTAVDKLQLKRRLEVKNNNLTTTHRFSTLLLHYQKRHWFFSLSPILFVCVCICATVTSEFSSGWCQCGRKTLTSDRRFYSPVCCFLYFSNNNSNDHGWVILWNVFLVSFSCPCNKEMSLTLETTNIAKVKTSREEDGGQTRKISLSLD